MHPTKPATANTANKLVAKRRMMTPSKNWFVCEALAAAVGECATGRFKVAKAIRSD
jgi:hypothetical protein